jgi:hypothetical protein
MEEEQVIGYKTDPKHRYKKSTIISIGQEKPLALKERHYVDKVEFYNELVIRRALVDQYKIDVVNNPDIKPPRITNKVGECILKICNGLAKKYTFSKLDFKEEMILAAVEQCLRYIDSFDINVTQNPFSYFTQTAYYSYLDSIKRETEEKYLKYKSTLESMAFQEYMENDTSENTEHVHDSVELPDIDYMRDFVKVFEENKAKKKADEKEKSKEKSKKSRASTLDDIWAS